MADQRHLFQGHLMPRYLSNLSSLTQNTGLSKCQTLIDNITMQRTYLVRRSAGGTGFIGGDRGRFLRPPAMALQRAGNWSCKILQSFTHPFHKSPAAAHRGAKWPCCGQKSEKANFTKLFMKFMKHLRTPQSTVKHCR